MKIRSSTEGGAQRRRALTPALLATTALTAAGLAFALTAGTAQADDWTGAVSSDWFTNGNWGDGTAPTTADDVRLNTVTPNPTVINGSDAQANGVNVGYVAGTGALTIENGGTLTNINADIARNSTAQGTVLVTGTGSQWSGNTLSVGQFGVGTLTIEDGGKVDFVTGYIGTGNGAHGTVTVTGDGSQLVNDWGGTKIAVSGTGMLNIENRGAVITNGNAQIGIFADGVGTANVTGNGSRWTIAGDLEVGYQGTGTLTIGQGAVVSNSATIVGEDSGSTGTLNLNGVSGARGVLETNTVSTTAGTASIVFDGGILRARSNQPGLIGAGFAPGDITVASGGAYIDTNGWDVGFQSPLSGPGELIKQGDGTLVLFTSNTHGSTRVSKGTLAVYGSAASITHAAGEMIVGDTAGIPAELWINGGTVENSNGYIGQTSGSEGSATVTGGGSTWTNNGWFYIGEHGTGALTIQDGGSVVSNGVAAVGRDSGGIGTAMVTGSGSTWTTNGFLNIGDQPDSQGTLTIADQGTVISNSQVRLANAHGTQGTVLVTGAGSKWIGTPTQFHVGFWDKGTLTIADGGEVQSNFTTLGTWGGSAGTATVTGGGSVWNIGDDFEVGVRGAGLLTIENGGAVNSIDSTIGVEADGIGEVAVTGAGSTWTTSGSLFIGDGGSGTLTIADRGTVNSVEAYLARTAASTGAATVTGGGSTWNSGGLYVGENGQGTLTIANGGVVHSGHGDVGVYSDGTGFATVTGGGSTWTTSYLTVGEYGIGTLLIEEGGLVTNSATAYIGSEVGGVGDMTVTGSGSRWESADVQRIGSSGQGTLTIENGGVVTNTTDAFIGYEATSIGNVTVTGVGSTWESSGDLYVGRSGQGTLTIEDGGFVNPDETFIADQAGSIGAATVTGAGSHLITIWMAVGSAGAGTLTIADGGLVDNLGATIGRFVGSEGHALVTGTGSLWRPENDLWVGSEGRGALTVADGAVIETDEVRIAALAGSQGTVNIGAAVGGAPMAPGRLDTPLVQFGDGDGTLVFNHTASNYLFAPQIVGVGQIDLLAGATEMNNAAGFSGTTSVNSGATLVANTTLGGTLDVLAGGLLKGSGTVGSTTIAGTVAPGNSIGTLHVAGNYTQAAGSTYEVEIDAAGNSDRIDVTGSATLNGGTVEVIPFPDFALATPYTILTATGGITGTFAGATMGFSSAFLSPQLTYGSNDVTFAIARTGSFAGAALTPNQEEAAEGADSLGAGNAIWDAIALLPSASDAPAAFDAISGEVHASAASVLIEDSRFVREAIDARLRAAFAGVGANATPVLAYGDDGPEIAPADTGRFAAWGHAFGSWGEWDSDGNAASLSRDTGGFVLGGDMAVADIWRLGLLAGYSSSSFDIEDRVSSGSAESYHLGAYAGTEIGKLGLRFGGAYSWHDVETARTAAFPGFTDSLEADHDAATAQFFGEAGYRIDTKHASFEPFANLAYVNLHTDGFTESGGAAALTASSSSHDTTFATLGLRAETTLPLGNITARLHGMLGWRHAFGDITPTSDLAFAGGSTFSIAGVPIAEDAAIIEAGLDLALSPNANLGIAYNGQIGGGASDHGLKARFGMTF